MRSRSEEGKEGTRALHRPRGWHMGRYVLLHQRLPLLDTYLDVNMIELQHRIAESQ